MQQEREKYQPPKAHRLDSKWFESLDDRHKELHLLAQNMLKSSYFADRTHGIKKVIKAQETAAQPKSK
jgi:hypothetical protein